MLKSPRLVAIAAVLLSVSGLWLIWNHLTDECLSEASRTADTIFHERDFGDKTKSLLSPLVTGSKSSSVSAQEVS